MPISLLEFFQIFGIELQRCAAVRLTGASNDAKPSQATIFCHSTFGGQQILFHISMIFVYSK